MGVDPELILFGGRRLSVHWSTSDVHRSDRHKHVRNTSVNLKWYTYCICNLVKLNIRIEDLFCIPYCVFSQCHNLISLPVCVYVLGAWLLLGSSSTVLTCSDMSNILVSCCRPGDQTESDLINTRSPQYTVKLTTPDKAQIWPNSTSDTYRTSWNQLDRRKTLAFHPHITKWLWKLCIAWTIF